MTTPTTPGALLHPAWHFLHRRFLFSILTYLITEGEWTTIPTVHIKQILKSYLLGLIPSLKRKDNSVRKAWSQPLTLVCPPPLPSPLSTFCPSGSKPVTHSFRWGATMKERSQWSHGSSFIFPIFEKTCIQWSTTVYKKILCTKKEISPAINFEEEKQHPKQLDRVIDFDTHVRNNRGWQGLRLVGGSLSKGHLLWALLIGACLSTQVQYCCADKIFERCRKSGVSCAIFWLWSILLIHSRPNQKHPNVCISLGYRFLHLQACLLLYMTRFWFYFFV